MSNFFDLDISFEDDGEKVDLSKIAAKDLLNAIQTLPEPLKEVALGILYQRRTFSDVSQDLGIRQSELVTRLHRAQLAISIELMRR
jgi:DNA-directed RNA polymerase specialized sigma24 family protein